MAAKKKKAKKKSAAPAKKRTATKKPKKKAAVKATKKATKKAVGKAVAKKLTSFMIPKIKGTRDGEEDDLETIHNDDWKDAIDAGELRVFEGDLKVDGHLDASGGALMVKGNLTVSGNVGLDETGSLIVTGNVQCRNLSCEGNLEIQGDTTVDETIFGYYEAGITFFEGKIKARLFLEGNHAFEYDNKQLVKGTTHLQFSNFSSLEKGTKQQAQNILSDEALEAAGRLMGITDEDKGGSDEVGRLLWTKGLLR